jgi:hypothetical protein
MKDGQYVVAGCPEINPAHHCADGNIMKSGQKGEKGSRPAHD